MGAIYNLGVIEMALPYPTEISRNPTRKAAPAPGTFKPAPGVSVRLPSLAKMPRVPLPRGPANANFLTYLPPALGRAASLAPYASPLGGYSMILAQAGEVVRAGNTLAHNSQYWDYTGCPFTPSSWWKPQSSSGQGCIVHARWAIEADGGGAEPMPASVNLNGLTVYDKGFRILPDPNWLHNIAYSLDRKAAYAGETVPLMNPYYVVVPSGAPGVTPIMKPGLAPQAKPWRDANARPGEEPAQDPFPRNTPVPKPSAYPLPAFPTVPAFLAPVAIPRPGGSPLPVQVPDIIVAPGSPGAPVRPGPPRGAKPTKKRHKNEKKMTVRNVAPRGLMIALGTITEGMDLVAALHKSLPKHLRAKPRRGPDGKMYPPSMKRKFAAVIRNFSEVDPNQAVANIFNNQVEDMFYAKQGKLAGRLQRQIGSPTGLSRAIKGPDRLGPEGDLLPQLEYNEQSNSWGWIWKP